MYWMTCTETTKQADGRGLLDMLWPCMRGCILCICEPVLPFGGDWQYEGHNSPLRPVWCFRALIHRSVSQHSFHHNMKSCHDESEEFGLLREWGLIVVKHLEDKLNELSCLTERVSGYFISLISFLSTRDVDAECPTKWNFNEEMEQTEKPLKMQD